MPRGARASLAGVCAHVLNRGNRREVVFRRAGDYEAFLRLMGQACERVPMRVLAYCLMPNHFHLVVWPAGDGDLGTWMQWLMTAHVRRYHRQYASEGHLWQGRYKAFPIQQDGHLLAVLRYVERNALRANLVRRAEDWPWSSLHGEQRVAPFLVPWPVPRPPDWRRFVNRADDEDELGALRGAANRGTPWGGAAWVEAAARRFGLEHTLRRRGRPPATAPK